MDKETNNLQKNVEIKQRKFSKIGFMAIYEPKEDTKKRKVEDAKSQPKLDANRKSTIEGTGIKQEDCCKQPYYKKRRYLCPGKRRYKAKNRCCSGRYNKNRINLCNRNWARISIYPFINFLRCFKKRFNKHVPISEIARRGRCKWKKMTCLSKRKYYEQAKRARIRGYRT